MGSRNRMTLTDFLTPTRHSPVLIAVYNWLWHNAGEVVSYETLGRAADGEYGAAYALTPRGRHALCDTILRLRQRIAATGRKDAPRIESMGYRVGYRLTCDKLSIWGPMTTYRPIPKQIRTTCLRGHPKVFKWDKWVCLTCRVAQRQAVQP